MPTFIVAAGRLLLAFTMAWTLSPASALSDVIRIAIDKLAFEPASITARVGDTVEWINHDIVVHTATATQGSWNVMIAPKKSGVVVLRSAGAIDYFCKFHPNMRGSIIVTR